jgi:hypothetical protein
VHRVRCLGYQVAIKQEALSHKEVLRSITEPAHRCRQYDSKKQHRYQDHTKPYSPIPAVQRRNRLHGMLIHPGVEFDSELAGDRNWTGQM